MTSIWKVIAIILFSTACQIAAFFPCLSEDYAYRDDYTAIRFFGKHENVFQTTYAKDGRWVTALVARPVFRNANEIEKLRTVRSLGVLGNLVFNCLLWAFLVRVIGLGLWRAALLATIASITFASAIYIGWTICYIYTWSSSLALLAGILGTAYGKHPLLSGVGQALLLFISLSIYQPTAFLYFLPVLLSLWAREGRGDWARPTFRAFLLFTGTMAAYFLLLVLFLKFGYENAEAVKRFGGELGFSLKQKWDHFQALLRIAFLVTSQDSRSPFYFLQPLLLLAPMLLFPVIRKDSLKEGLVKLAVVIFAFLFSFAPVLASNTFVAGHRVLPGSTVFILGLSLLSLVKLASGGVKASRLLGAGLILLLCTQVFQIHVALRNGIVTACQREFSVLQEAFARQFPTAPREMNFILSPWRMQEIGNGIYGQEFGRPSSNNRGNATWLIASIMDRQYGRQTELPKLNFIPYRERANFLKKADPETLAKTIDAARLLETGGAPGHAH